MKTNHQIHFNNSQNMSQITEGSVNLVVTSPPYPMIKMWDEMFCNLNPQIDMALKCGDGVEACFLMNQELDKVWLEVDRILEPGGIVCINIGDATRKVGGQFRLYANHSHIINTFDVMEYTILPYIIWKKETNRPTKFMGSGTMPPSAYVTLEHEYILIFRKGGPKKYKSSQMQRRRESSYFWEERNNWFSDIWSDLKGVSQNLKNIDSRNRSGAFPFELAYRLINMYSLYESLVLDPFLGTGTTTVAAACAGRNSIGYEIDNTLDTLINQKFQKLPLISETTIKKRIDSHHEFIRKREEDGHKFKYSSLNYGFPVITRPEQHIIFPVIENCDFQGNEFQVSYKL